MANADRPRFLISGGSGRDPGRGSPATNPTWPGSTMVWHFAWVGLLLVGAVAMLVDAQARRTAQAARQTEVQSVVRLLGVADLALSSSSRWLRHPSIAEPGAPFADGPAILDNDPAGAAISPPRAAPTVGQPSTSGRGRHSERK